MPLIVSNLFGYKPLKGITKFLRSIRMHGWKPKTCAAYQDSAADQCKGILKAKLFVQDQMRLAEWKPPAPPNHWQAPQNSPSFVLYRILGNDLYPRHMKGQTRENARFILKHEPTLPNCEKRWIINRIFDPEEETQIIQLLQENNQPFLRIPFISGAYRQVGMDHECFPDVRFWFKGDFSGLSEKSKIEAEMQIFRLKNLYAMNNNGARNAALYDGRNRADFVLPWDGNCFVTLAAWKQILDTISSLRYLPYFVTPMARITDNTALLDPEFTPIASEEPQIIFRNDATEVFDERFPYGRRPKVELLWRLAVPGPWDRWKDHPWDLPRSPESSDARCFGVAGWVARLNSGQTHLESSTKVSFQNRGLARAKAIRQTLTFLDTKLLKGKFRQNSLLFYNEESINAIAEPKHPLNEHCRETVQKLLPLAQEALNRGPFSVTDKPQACPGGDKHDYWHPAPYWWPNPETVSGYPYIRRDGMRVPGTVLYEPESDRYDRTRLQRLFDDSTILALTSAVTGDNQYARHAGKLFRTWFLNPSTRMNPHLRFSQSKGKTPSSEGSPSGIIETKDFYFYLDAVRLLRKTEAIDHAEVLQFCNWLKAFRHWIRESDQGIKEMSQPNNHGILYDVQDFAISAFLGDVDCLARILRRAKGRIAHHFETDGQQPYEMKRTLTAHYCAFNLQAWINMSLLARNCGDPLAYAKTQSGKSIEKAINWFLSETCKGVWEHPQITPFSWKRLYPIAAFSDTYYKTNWSAKIHVAEKKSPYLHPHDGVAPFWEFSLKTF
jgi:hypothetical protein